MSEQLDLRDEEGWRRELRVEQEIVRIEDGLIEEEQAEEPEVDEDHQAE